MILLKELLEFVLMCGLVLVLAWVGFCGFVFFVLLYFWWEVLLDRIFPWRRSVRNEDDRR